MYRRLDSSTPPLCVSVLARTNISLCTSTRAFRHRAHHFEHTELVQDGVTTYQTLITVLDLKDVAAIDFFNEDREEHSGEYDKKYADNRIQYAELTHPLCIFLKHR